MNINWGTNPPSSSNPFCLIDHDQSNFQINIVNPTAIIHNKSDLIFNFPIVVRIDAINGKDLNNVTFFLDGQELGANSFPALPTFSYAGLLTEYTRIRINSSNGRTVSGVDPEPLNVPNNWYMDDFVFIYDFSQLTESVHNLIVRATDIDGINYDCNYQFRIDTIPPTAPDSDHSPSKGANNVPNNTNILLHVKDINSGVNQSTISMTVKVDGVDVPGNITITGSSSDYTVTFDPNSDFANDKKVYVTVNASDLAGNAMAQESYSFDVIGSILPPTKNGDQDFVRPISGIRYPGRCYPGRCCLE